MFHKMPIILLALIGLVLCLDGVLPVEAKSFLYAVSLSIKSLIVFALPIIIFGLLFKVAVSLSRNATGVILFILAAVCASNFLSTMISHGVGTWVYGFDISLSFPQEGEGLMPTWALELPKWIGNAKAMFAGLILGMAFSWIKRDAAAKVADVLERVVSSILRVITYSIPLFVTGFIVKLQYDGVMGTIFKNYAMIFAVIGGCMLGYVLLMYWVANDFSWKRVAFCLRNMSPAAIAGFSTMSSAAVMPLTIMGTEKNARHPDLARSVIPATANIHLIGDCFAICIFAHAILKSYGMPLPDFSNYLIFAFYFVIAKFSVAAIPGGGVLVMLPVLEAYLGFNAEMMSMITALYILFDPVITCTNILGNGAFALLIGKLQGKFSKQGAFVAPSPKEAASAESVSSES